MFDGNKMLRTFHDRPEVAQGFFCAWNIAALLKMRNAYFTDVSHEALAQGIRGIEYHSIFKEDDPRLLVTCTAEVCSGCYSIYLNVHCNNFTIEMGVRERS